MVIVFFVIWNKPFDHPILAVSSEGSIYVVTWLFIVLYAMLWWSLECLVMQKCIDIHVTKIYFWGSELVNLSGGIFHQTINWNAIYMYGWKDLLLGSKVWYVVYNELAHENMKNIEKPFFTEVHETARCLVLWRFIYPGKSQ